MIMILKAVHLLSLSTWFGAMVFFSFFSAPAIFRVLPRKTAGQVVGEIFPRYWALGYICAVLACVTLIYLYPEAGPLAGPRLAVILAMTGVAFFSGLFVGGRARRVKALMNAADEGERGELTAKFRKIHAVSSVLNLIIILLGAAVLVMTAASMAPA